MKKINRKYTNIIFMIVIMSIALAVAGHFLFLRYIGDARRSQADDPVIEKQPSTPPSEEQMREPVSYIHRSEIINGLLQEINILEIHPGDPGVQIKPVLSHDLIYGYELLSEMAGRKGAYAAINGGFFRDFGLPSGMVVIDGELYSIATGNYPVFIISDGKAELKEVKSELSIAYGNPASAGIQDSEKIIADNINFPGTGKQTVIYTPAYGRNNRADRRNISVTVENGIAARIADYEKEAAIPQNGILITFYDIARFAGIELPIKVGDTVQVTHSPDLTGNVQAYECGCWLVKDGISVVGERDPWVGVLTNHDPRTAVGIREDGTVILLTVDGRQPGYSAGFTGQELADYMISCGAVDAAMLDGGASTEMLVEGKLVSRPSYKGQEREMAGGILVLLDK